MTAEEIIKSGDIRLIEEFEKAREQILQEKCTEKLESLEKVEEFGEVRDFIFEKDLPIGSFFERDGRTYRVISSWGLTTALEIS